jgi:hypothetical protein
MRSPSLPQANGGMYWAGCTEPKTLAPAEIHRARRQHGADRGLRVIAEEGAEVEPAGREAVRRDRPRRTSP